MPSVTILNQNRVVECAPGATILEAALDAGIDYPFGCHSGACGACKTRLLAGAVDLGEHSELALSPAERAEGMILACCAVPRQDCSVLYLDASAPQHPLRTVVAHVAEAAPATHDIMIVRLALPAGEPRLAFSAGQFATLTFPGLPARDYSMANRPDEELLAFHIRRVPDGKVSGFVHAGAIRGQPVTVRGPFGVSYLREDHPGPILAAAGGSGLAPIASIVETALQRGFAQRIALYFGARSERDLYLVERFEDLARRHPNLEYVPVLSNTAPGETRRRTGFLADAIRADFSDLSGWKAYIAGPPPMVDTVTAAVAAAGVRPEDRHTDPFYTAADRGVPSPAG